MQRHDLPARLGCDCLETPYALQSGDIVHARAEHLALKVLEQVGDVPGQYLDAGVWQSHHRGLMPWLVTGRLAMDTPILLRIDPKRLKRPVSRLPPRMSSRRSGPSSADQRQESCCVLEEVEADFHCVLLVAPLMWVATAKVTTRSACKGGMRVPNRCRQRPQKEYARGPKRGVTTAQRVQGQR
jgi:hypothetical protein